MAQMKVGLLGLGRGGQQLADALLRSSWAQLVAVASAKPERLTAFHENHRGIATYNDFRSLIVGQTLDALFVALPPHQRPRYLALAAERKLPVWMLPPPARSLEELAEVVRRFDEAACPIVLARSWGHESSLRADSELVQRAGPVYLASGQVSTYWSGELDWRGDRQSAGGGVLLDRGYGLLDTALQVLGMPAKVFAALGRGPLPARSPYDTEDTAALTALYPGGGVLSLTASRVCGPETWSLHLHGATGSLEIGRERVVTRDRAGGAVIAEEARPAQPLLQEVDEFLSRLQSSPRTLRSKLSEHLSTMAVVQAAYLSARTGQPESPQALLDMQGLRVLSGT
jgi:myo-inositol 2-dehydrogenase / D-chiro-inositol 1-dehydrogenase